MKIKQVEDYYDQIKEKFPELSLKQIDRILKFGFRSYYTHVLYGGDMLNKSPYFTMYCGKFFKNWNIFQTYRMIKSRIKLRVKYKKKKTQWDGYYYFGLTEEEFQHYKKQKNKTGKRRKKFHFNKVKFFKILDEVFVDYRLKHIFKIPYPMDCGFAFWKEDFVTRDFEYIYRRKKDGTIEPISYE